MNNYMMLGRLVQDCRYWLKFGGRCDKHLYCGSPAAQIGEIYRLYYGFAYDERPEWLTETQIAHFDMRMNGLTAKEAHERKGIYKWCHCGTYRV